MAYSFLVFDFGGDEALAQQARHKIEGWKQGFRLDKKLQLKFERKEPEAANEDASPKTARSSSTAKTASKGKSKTDGDAGQEPALDTESAEIRMIVRLDFSDHEKLSHHRWLERIPGEEPFKGSKPKIVRADDAEFEATAELFDSLD